MNELQVMNEERSVQDVTEQVSKIQDLMRKVMRDGEHFGVIPGTGKKPSLLKPGAEKLCFVFRLVPEFDITMEGLDNGHREYRIKCTLKSMASGAVVGEGLGSCSTMESKYRYRNAGDFEITDQPIPKDAKEKKAEYRKQGFGMKQVDGAWCWVRYKSEGKVENPDIADTYNTVLKMAKKRAIVDATITACAASDIFTQDVEDFRDEDREEEGHHNERRTEQPDTKPSAPKPTAHAQAHEQPAIDYKSDILKTFDAIGKILTATNESLAPYFTEDEMNDARSELKRIRYNAEGAIEAMRIKDHYEHVLEERKQLDGVPFGNEESGELFDQGA